MGTVLPEVLQPTSILSVSLRSGRVVDLPRCRPTFEVWRGAPVFALGGKPLLTWDGKPIFAELLVLRLLSQCGWAGAWASRYGGLKYVNDMPSDWLMTDVSTSLPIDKSKLLDAINPAGARRGSGCFDIVAWCGDKLLFCECKRKCKDALRGTQLAWIDSALQLVSVRSLLIVEWSGK